MASPLPSVCRGFPALAAIAAFTFFSTGARASEPFKPDVTQGTWPEQAHTFDHLLPVRNGEFASEFVRNGVDPPQASFMAVYFEDAFGREGNHVRYLVLFKTQDGRYILRTSSVPNKKIPLWPETPKGWADVEIPQSLADVIYQIWLNELLETRYKKSMVDEMEHDTTWEFSACYPGLGDMDGTITGATAGKNQPPAWLIDTGEALLKFAADPHRDPKQMETQLDATRDKLFAYLKLHGVQ